MYRGRGGRSRGRAGYIVIVEISVEMITTMMKGINNENNNKRNGNELIIRTEGDIMMISQNDNSSGSCGDRSFKMIMLAPRLV